MSLADSECFPRGGKISVPQEREKRKLDDNLFRHEKQPKAKRARKEKKITKETINENTFQSSLLLQGTLSYNKIHNGLVVLSCVRTVSNLALQIEFPGLTFGHVAINSISDPFTKTLTEKMQSGDEESFLALQSLFEPGQLVVAKIMSVEHKETGHEVQASINPKDVNADRNCYSFKKGMHVWACIQSELEHGYELNVGVKNCRVFLPFKNVDAGKTYTIGETLFCVIHKATNDIIASTLRVSAKKEHLENNQLNRVDNLQDIIPGLKVDFHTEEVTQHGIKGKFLETYFGYIDETQLFSIKTLNDISEGIVLEAYVLFVEPVTNVTYLTLRGIDIIPGPVQAMGKILKGQILSFLPKGVYVRIGQNEKGFVTNRRLVNSLPKDTHDDVMDVVKRKYSVGSTHSCKILNYNRMEQIYICTVEQKLVKEKISSVQDFQLGQIINVKITKITPNGLVANAGRIQGFIPNLHISNVAYSDNIKNKYFVGMIVKAKILNITSDDNVIFTLKQGLLESDNCLSTPDEAIANCQFTGFVAQTKLSGALIAFYGNVTGWIRSKELNSNEITTKFTDPREYFFRGQVVNVWIKGLDSNKLLVSLTPSLEKEKNQIHVGDTLKGLVTGIRSDCIDVEVGKNHITATIPVNHISSSLELCSFLLQTFKVGEELHQLVCIKSGDVPVFSIRESIAYEQQSFKVMKFQQLKVDQILRCSYETSTNSGIYVSVPIRNYHKNIFIGNENLFSEGETCPRFKLHQSILAKILSVDLKSTNIVLGARIDQIPTNLENELFLLSGYIKDLNRVMEHGINNGFGLSAFIPGARVQCVVEKIDNKGGCILKLPNKVIGLVPKNLCPDNLSVGNTVEGVVLFNDLNNNCIDICLKNNIKQKINKTQDGIIKKSLHSYSMAEILLFTENCTIGVLTEKDCNRQLIYLPISSHENDQNRIKFTYGKSKFKVFLDRRVCNKLIGVDKKCIKELCKQNKEIKAKTKQRKKRNLREYEIKDNNLKVNDKLEDSHLGEGNNNNLNEVENKDIMEVEQYEETESPEVKEEVCEEIISEDLVKTDNPNIDSLENNNFDEDDNDSEKVKIENISKSVIKSSEKSIPILSGINSFFAIEEQNGESESSSDEEPADTVQRKKKKKLTPAEKTELAKLEEERILKIERELADSNDDPQSAEQFERLLLANPNSSELWMKYIAMHISTAELDKARSVGKKALETINMTEVKEKFNIWIALLNLENMYGTKESFDKLFDDAIRYNDSLDIYLSVIKLLANAGKLNEMEEKIKKIRMKEKQSTKMWLEIGQVYYQLNKFREARNMKEAALKSILDNRRQFDLIVRFGIMEFHNGDLDQAIANFETILETYPSKVNIWTLYVDQLIKKNQINLARKVLERASRQKLAVKSMKTIFQKFVLFEEQHGTKENLENIKTMAKEYVHNLDARFY